MLHDDEVAKIVKDTVRGQLAPGPVDVRVRKGVDEDGNPLLNILVIIDASSEFDKRKMLGLVRHIRSNLDEANSHEFPLLTFVSRREAARLNFEAA